MRLRGKYEDRWRRHMAERIAYHDIVEEDRKREAEEGQQGKRSA